MQNFDNTVLGHENPSHPMHQIEVDDYKPSDPYDAFEDYKNNPNDETNDAMLDSIKELYDELKKWKQRSK